MLETNCGYTIGWRNYFGHALSSGTAETIVSSDSQTEGMQPGTNKTDAMCDFLIPRVRTTICYCTNKLDGTRLWGLPSVCHQPRRIHNGTSSKSSLLGCGEQWAVSTDRRLPVSFSNSRFRGGDNQWKCSICFMSTAEHTTEDNHFFLSYPYHPSLFCPLC